MPTPTIDPVIYEAAYAAIKQNRYDQFNVSLIELAIVGVIFFIVWLFTEG